MCIVAIQSCKTMGIISYRDFNKDEARKCTYTRRHYKKTTANNSLTQGFPFPSSSSA